MNKVLNLTYESSITDLCEVNSSFAAGVVQIAYTGRNRNGSVISKEVFEKCLPTIYNCPIVCNYNREDNDFGSHDIEVVKDDNGDFKLINVTTPIGVVPLNAKTFWKTDKGHEYLCVEALFWKRQEAYDKLQEDGFASQSMEITVKSGHKDKKSGDYIIEDFEFTAFCALGENVEPCFESANIALYSKTALKEQIEAMMNDFKASFNLVEASTDVDDKTEILEEGGNVVLKDFELKPIVTDPAEDDDAVVVEDTDDSAEPLLAAMGAPTPEPEDEESPDNESEEQESDDQDDNASEDTDEDAKDGDDDNSEEAYALNSVVSNEIFDRVRELEIYDFGWGPEPRYWVWDYDLEASLVYCEDGTDWKLYSFSYSMNGDNVVIDTASKKRVKVVYAEFDEGSKDLSLSTVFNALTDNIVAKYHEASDTISSIETELTELRQFKAETEGAIENEKRESVFAQFDDLAGVEAFEKLKESDYDCDTLEEKCYAIRGKMATRAEFSLETKSPKLPVDKTEVMEDVTKAPYGGIVENLLHR